MEQRARYGSDQERDVAEAGMRVVRAPESSDLLTIDCNEDTEGRNRVGYVLNLRSRRGPWEGGTDNR